MKANVIEGESIAVSMVDIMLKGIEDLPLEHLKNREEDFKRDQPFYTCINSEKGIWTKELKTGEVFLVQMDYDLKNEESIEKIIKQVH
jgi:hypothetical protein